MKTGAGYAMGLLLAGLAGAAMLPAAGSTQDRTIVVTARQAGLIGERYDGYLGAVGALTSAQRSQVATVNIKRRKLYYDLAARRGVSPQEVGIAAGCQLLARIEPGEYYLLGDSQWRRRDAGQPVLRPTYCG